MKHFIPNTTKNLDQTRVRLGVSKYGRGPRGRSPWLPVLLRAVPLSPLLQARDPQSPVRAGRSSQTLSLTWEGSEGGRVGALAARPLPRPLPRLSVRAGSESAGKVLFLCNNFFPLELCQYLHNFLLVKCQKIQRLEYPQWGIFRLLWGGRSGDVRRFHIM